MALVDLTPVVDKLDPLDRMEAHLSDVSGKLDQLIEVVDRLAGALTPEARVPVPDISRAADAVANPRRTRTPMDGAQ